MTRAYNPRRKGFHHDPCVIKTDLETGRDTVTAHAVAGWLHQEWTHPFDGGTHDLHGAPRNPENGRELLLTSDVFHPAAAVNGERTETAQPDGRFLSFEAVESLSGPVICFSAAAGDDE